MEMEKRASASPSSRISTRTIVPSLAIVSRIINQSSEGRSSFLAEVYSRVCARGSDEDRFLTFYFLLVSLVPAYSEGLKRAEERA